MGEKDVSEMMPIRVIGYDGSAYRAQLSEYDSEVRKWMELNKQKPKKLKPDMKQHERPVFHPAPVITIVLYFGLDHWDKKLHLKDLLDIPVILDPYVNDYKNTVFEIAWLSDEQINAFKSDFQIIARFYLKSERERTTICRIQKSLSTSQKLSICCRLLPGMKCILTPTPWR